MIFVIQNIAMLVNSFADVSNRVTMNISIVLILFTGIILIIAADVFNSYSQKMSFKM